MTTLTAPVRAPVSISRRYLAAGTFILLGLIDIFVFGFFAHSGDARFALSLPGASPHLPTIHVPGALTAYVLGAISIGLGILRAVVDLPRWGKRLSIAVVLLVAAPPLIRLLFRLRATGGTGPQAVASKGWSG